MQAAAAERDGGGAGEGGEARLLCALPFSILSLSLSLSCLSASLHRIADASMRLEVGSFIDVLCVQEVLREPPICMEALTKYNEAHVRFILNFWLLPVFSAPSLLFEKVSVSLTGVDLILLVSVLLRFSSAERCDN